MSIQSQLIKENETVAAYIRVSLVRQEEEGYSMDAQMKKIYEFVEKNNWHLPENLIFREARPATNSNIYELDKVNFIENFSIRPKLSELLQKAQKKEFKHLIVYSRDRLSRSVEDALALELFLNKCNIKIHYVKMGEDFQDSNSEVSRLLHIIFTSLAELECNILASRVFDGGKSCILKGRWAGGRPPAGYRITTNKCESENKKKWYSTLEKLDFDSKLIEEAYNLYSAGLGYRKVAEYMNEKYGFIVWSKSKIERIIKNRTYSGQVAWDRRGGRRNPRKRNNDPILSPFKAENSIISIEDWNKIDKEREKRNKSKDAFYYDTEFILRDKLKCSKCERIFKTKNPGPGKSNVYKCANTKGERNICNVIIPSALVESKFIEYMKNEIFIKKEKINDDEKKEINKEIFWNKYEEGFSGKYIKYLEMIEKVNQKIKSYEDLVMKIKNIIYVEKDDHIKEALHTQHAIYNNLIDQYKKSLKYLEQQINVVKKNKEEIYGIISNFIPSLFISQNSKEITRMRREFIINFVEEIIVSYDKDKKEVIIHKIEFNSPEYM